MRRPENDQTPGKFNACQSRAYRRAAVYMPGMRKEQHQRTTCCFRKFGFLSEPGGKFGSLPTAQMPSFPHEAFDLTIQAPRISGIKISRNCGGTGYTIVLLTHLLHPS